MFCYDVTSMLSVRFSNTRQNVVFPLIFICLFIYFFIEVFVSLQYIPKINWNILRVNLCDFYRQIEFRVWKTLLLLWSMTAHSCLYKWSKTASTSLVTRADTFLHWRQIVSNYSNKLNSLLKISVKFFDIRYAQFSRYPHETFSNNVSRILFPSHYATDVC
jgi:hypothetical protein